jgi:hypothetical protein
MLSRLLQPARRMGRWRPRPSFGGGTGWGVAPTAERGLCHCCFRPVARNPPAAIPMRRGVREMAVNCELAVRRFFCFWRATGTSFLKFIDRRSKPW